jgi:hypothetical protein
LRNPEVNGDERQKSNPAGFPAIRICPGNKIPIAFCRDAKQFLRIHKTQSSFDAKTAFLRENPIGNLFRDKSLSGLGALAEKALKMGIS